MCHWIFKGFANTESVLRWKKIISISSHTPREVNKKKQDLFVVDLWLSLKSLSRFLPKLLPDIGIRNQKYHPPMQLSVLESWGGMPFPKSSWESGGMGTAVLWHTASRLDIVWAALGAKVKRTAMAVWVTPDRMKWLFLTHSHSVHLQIWHVLKMLLILYTAAVPKQTGSESLSPPRRYFLPFPILPQPQSPEHSKPWVCRDAWDSLFFTTPRVTAIHLEPQRLWKAWWWHILPVDCTFHGHSNSIQKWFHSPGEVSKLLHFLRAVSCSSSASVITSKWRSTHSKKNTGLRPSNEPEGAQVHETWQDGYRQVGWN